MRRVSFFAIQLVLVAVVLAGCFSAARKDPLTLMVSGLSSLSGAKTVQWAANGGPGPEVIGSREVSGDSLAVPLALSQGEWTIAVSVLDNKGAVVATQEHQQDVGNGSNVLRVVFPNGGTDEAESGDDFGDELYDNEVDENPDLQEIEDALGIDFDAIASEDESVSVEEDEGISAAATSSSWTAWDGTKQPKPTGTLNSGSFTTPYYINRSGIPGPVVLITGGVHGNEPAGSQAAWKFVSVKPKKGTLVVIPEINRPGLKSNERSGAWPGDPNRAYPTSSGGSAKDKYARAIWNFVKSQKPTWVVDLHEGYDFHRINKNSVGQSVILYPGTSSQYETRYSIVQKMIAAANKTVSKSSHRFSYLKYPATGSLARAAGQYLGAGAMILETSTKQSRSLRIKQHETMVNTLLSELGMR